MTTQTASLPSFATSVPTYNPRGAAKSLKTFCLRCISEWWRRMRERRQLARLCDRDLADISCSRADARAEISKWFWQA